MTEQIIKIEEWRPVVGYEGVYEVSNFGRCRSLDRQVNGRVINHKNIIKGKFVGSIFNNGYVCIKLRNSSGAKVRLLHRLIAIAFLPNPLNKRTVNHINGNKIDNRLWNLEWSTYAENIQHSVKTGLRPFRNICQYNKDGKFIKTWKSRSTASKELNISRQHISRCIEGKRETAGGYQWKNT